MKFIMFRFVNWECWEEHLGRIREWQYRHCHSKPTKKDSILTCAVCGRKVEESVLKSKYTEALLDDLHQQDIEDGSALKRWVRDETKRTQRCKGCDHLVLPHPLHALDENGTTILVKCNSCGNTTRKNWVEEGRP